MHEGPESVRLGLRGIPSASEDVMVARDLLLAELTGARFHVAHLSTSRSVAMVAFAKSRGLHSDAAKSRRIISPSPIRNSATYDSNYKMKPPLRCQHDVDAVIEGIVRRRGRRDRDRSRAARGQRKDAGIRALPVRHHRARNRYRAFACELVHKGRISVSRMVELFTTGPADILESESRHARAGRTRRRHGLRSGRPNGRSMFSSRFRKAATLRSTGGSSVAARWRRSSGAKSYGTQRADNRRRAARPARRPDRSRHRCSSSLCSAARWAASMLIDYSWWKELGQVNTWIDLYAYSTLPVGRGHDHRVDCSADCPRARGAFRGRAGQRLSPSIRGFRPRSLLALAFFVCRCEHRQLDGAALRRQPRA